MVSLNINLLFYLSYLFFNRSWWIFFTFETEMNALFYNFIFHYYMGTNSGEKHVLGETLRAYQMMSIALVTWLDCHHIMCMSWKGLIFFFFFFWFQVTLNLIETITLKLLLWKHKIFSQSSRIAVCSQDRWPSTHLRGREFTCHMRKIVILSHEQSPMW